MQTDLISQVPGKQYIGFHLRTNPNVISRATNRRFFNPDRNYLANNWDRWLTGEMSPDDLARMSYTAAISPCLAMDLFDRQNKKQPATYFECLIGNMFARMLNVVPEKKTTLTVKDTKVRMTMDFLFHVGNGIRIR